MHNTGSKTIIADEEGDPHFVDIDSYIFGLPEQMEKAFPLCNMRHAKKDSLLGGYFGDSKLLDSQMITNIQTRDAIAEGETN